MVLGRIDTGEGWRDGTSIVTVVVVIRALLVGRFTLGAAHTAVEGGHLPGITIDQLGKVLTVKGRRCLCHLYFPRTSSSGCLYTLLIIYCYKVVIIEVWNKHLEFGFGQSC